MGQINIIQADEKLFERQQVPMPHFTAEDYLRRVELLLERMNREGLSHVVIYGDREHFANIEYFSGYDCRFEEGLLIFDSRGARHIVVGNEGYGYSYQIPYEINRILYQNFSLQGQPRGESKSLQKIFDDVGIGRDSRVGVAGYKYFYHAHFQNPDQVYDLPLYIMDALFESAGREHVSNFTRHLTGLPDGIRMQIRTPKEVAWAEYSAVKCANVLLNLLEGLETGTQEIEVSRRGRIDFSPVCMFSLVNFGSRNLSLGLRSPDDNTLKLGDVCGLCYGVRGSLTSRTGVAARTLEDYPEAIRPSLESFYKPFWRAIAAWYETVRSGVCAGDVYEAVMGIIGGPEFGVALNPGHNTGMDEWTNSPVYKGSPLPIPSGSYMQCDIIASRSDPFQNAICEDTVVIADRALREQIQQEYPALFARVLERQKRMRELLGIQLDDSVLPMSNLNGVYFPFMLDQTRIFSK